MKMPSFNQPLTTLIAATLIGPLSGNAFSGNEISPASGPANVASTTLGYDIDVAEWSLRYSSVSAEIPLVVMDKSVNLLDRARAELDAGNIRTAQELVRRASEPLARMGVSAMDGKHPDLAMKEDEIRLAMHSIIATAERIVEEKAASSDFISEARASLARVELLRKQGLNDEATRLLTESYAMLQKQVAQLRAGENFYIEAPKGRNAADWSDGLRRVEERRYISAYLMTEATHDGLDVAVLVEGIASAEANVAEALRQAEVQRWDQALGWLDRAYAQYEDAWRTVGVDW